MSPFELLVAFMAPILVYTGTQALRYAWGHRADLRRRFTRAEPQVAARIELLRAEAGSLSTDHAWRYFRCQLCTTEWKDLMPIASEDAVARCTLCGNHATIGQIQATLRNRLLRAQQDSEDLRRAEIEEKAMLEKDSKAGGRKLDL